jgi:hypothetical protein
MEYSSTALPLPIKLWTLIRGDLDGSRRWSLARRSSSGSRRASRLTSGATFQCDHVYARIGRAALGLVQGRKGCCNGTSGAAEFELRLSQRTGHYNVIGLATRQHAVHYHSLWWAAGVLIERSTLHQNLIGLAAHVFPVKFRALSRRGLGRSFAGSLGRSLGGGGAANFKDQSCGCGLASAVTTGHTSHCARAIRQVLAAAVHAARVGAERVRRRGFRMGVTANVECEAHRGNARTTHHGANAKGRIVTVDNVTTNEILHLVVGRRINEFPSGHISRAQRSASSKMTQKGRRVHLVHN